ncbi:putative phosphoenolpyruvate synthase [Argiope bruennichi]|uniref:putative phosphoenolpyruvate synthase n=1 Tax=Argiope bruennichi TaxID=94029 RepID=UPI002494CAEA|nr:putative phosphoenolpyruvate synthase [Argiope bruennichi]
MVLSSISKIFEIPLDFIFWIKWIITYIAIRILSAFQRKKFDLYDIDAIGDPVKLGYIVPQLEKEIEAPFPESHLPDASDEITFYGVNSKSESFFVRISRGLNQKADAFVHLKLATGKTYSLVETVGYQESSDGYCHAFSCGKLRVHYVCPMRRWRIFYCGMLKETSENKNDFEELVFVKFALSWKASSDVYDLTVDTNPQEFANAIARSDWELPLVPPIQKFNDAFNLYAQTGVITGTISVNDGPDYEIYLFGEKIRNLGKNDAASGCKFTTILGNSPSDGTHFHLSEFSIPHTCKNLPLGFLVEQDGEIQLLKKSDISVKPFTAESSQSSFEAHFTSENNYVVSGTVKEPITFSNSQGWIGSFELSSVEFTVNNRKGFGFILSGEIKNQPKKPKPTLSIGFPDIVPLTVQFTEDASHFGEISGGKGSSLGKLTLLSEREKTFTVPKGIVVTTAAYSEFLTQEIRDGLKHLENVAYGNEEGDLKEVCSKVHDIVKNTSLPNKIRSRIIEDLKEIFGEEVNHRKFAIRSSATGEDTTAMSAAGQMDTFLGVQGLEEIFLAVRKCWASQFGHIAIEYKRRYGQILNCPMAVVIQEMVACDVSGIMFTCDPVTNNPSVITVTANYGLGETVVSGSVEPDTFILRRKNNDNILELESVTVGRKQQKIIMKSSGGVITEDIDENLRDNSCLSKEIVERLGKIGIKIEEFYKSSRDIEWGIVNDSIYILQSRPVTNATAETDDEIMHEFDAPLRWENEFFTTANVGEVMPSAISPLGIDLATKYFNIGTRRLMTGFGFSDILFKSKYFLTGILIFNYRMMMNAIEMIIQHGLGTPSSDAFMMSVYGRILDDPDLILCAKERSAITKMPKLTLKVLIATKWNAYFSDFGIQKIKKRIVNYHQKFLKQKTAKETFKALINSCSDFDEVCERHMTCSSVSSEWNMSMYNVLSKDAKNSSDVYSDFSLFLASTSEVESADVPQAMQRLASQITKDIGREKFRSMTIEEAEEWLNTTTSLSGNNFKQFLERHGHRCIQETDVHSTTWYMDPKPLIKILQNLAGVNKGAEKKEENIDEIFSKVHIPLSFKSKLYLRFILPQCRRFVRAREACKANTMKCFDYWRKACRRLGKQMVSEGRIPDEDLIFFFTFDEIQDLLNTRSPAIISKAIHRRKVFPTLQKFKYPEIMKGLPKPINYEDESADAYQDVADLVMKGTPVSQGIAKGYARVALNINEASHLKPGEILITHSTDIGWSPYFPIIAGVVTEIGGLISHGAVVSREYGLPCVVGLQEATRKFRTGDYVLLDGKKGVLQRLPNPNSNDRNEVTIS